jgi:rhodanese-related sulfurtransferase
VRTFHQILCLILTAVIPAGASALWNKHKTGWKAFADQQLSLAEVSRWGEKVLWVDARAESAYEADHIPGALLLNEDDWTGLLPGLVQVWSPDRIIVVYCSSRSCQASEEVAKRLREEAGFSSVFVLKGGWETWLAEKKGGLR